MKLTNNFSSKEFACKCGCGNADVDLRLVTALQILRDQIGKPIIITSGLRCERHNRNCGGAPKSYHVPNPTGRAADIKVAGLSTQELFEACKSIQGLRGFGLGASFLHVDIRESFAVWRYDSKGRVIAA